MTQKNTLPNKPTCPATCKWTLAATLTAGLLFGQAALGDPAGYERWTKPDSSFVNFDESCDSLAQLYSYPEFIGAKGIDRDSVIPNFYRLIDIEIRNATISGYDFVFDSVVVQNTGKFETPSWLLCNVSTKYLKGLEKGQHAFVLDAEKYFSEGEERWAVILQATTIPTRWKFITGYTVDQINAVLDIEGYRVIDIDHYDFKWEANQCEGSSGTACGDVPIPLYSAVIVKNEGANEIESKLKEVVGDESSIPSPMEPGMQLVDREIINLAKVLVRPTYWENPEFYRSAMVFVDVGNAYETHELQDQGEVQLNHIAESVVDIEWSRNTKDGFWGHLDVDWHTVNVDLP